MLRISIILIVCIFTSKVHSQTDNLYNTLESDLAKKDNREVLIKVNTYLSQNNVSDSDFAKLMGLQSKSI